MLRSAVLAKWEPPDADQEGRCKEACRQEGHAAKEGAGKEGRHGQEGHASEEGAGQESRTDQEGHACEEGAGQESRTGQEGTRQKAGSRDSDRQEGRTSPA